MEWFNSVKGNSSVAISYVIAKANKNEPNNFGSFFHILVCNRTCDNAVHCLHTPCAPARCAAGASLLRINSPVPLLRSLRSLQVLLSVLLIIKCKKYTK